MFPTYRDHRKWTRRRPSSITKLIQGNHNVLHLILHPRIFQSSQNKGEKMTKRGSEKSRQTHHFTLRTTLRRQIQRRPPLNHIEYLPLTIEQDANQPNGKKRTDSSIKAVDDGARPKRPKWKDFCDFHRRSNQASTAHPLSPLRISFND